MDWDQTSFSCSLLVLLIALKQGDREEETCNGQSVMFGAERKRIIQEQANTACSAIFLNEKQNMESSNTTAGKSGPVENTSSAEWIQQLRQP